MEQNQTVIYAQGVISRLVGVVVDVDFESGDLPSIHNALLVKRASGQDLVLEVQEHVGPNTVRAIAMGAPRACAVMPVVDTNDSIHVPVGKETLGRLFNVLGKPIDGKTRSTQRNSRPSTALLRVDGTGYLKRNHHLRIKAIDLLTPYPKAAKSVCLAALAWENGIDA